MDWDLDLLEIDAEEHDQVTSQISHFPHILASTLVEQAVAYGEEHEMTRRFAAGGFRDMTRIAESEPGMWTSILLSNPSSDIRADCWISKTFWIGWLRPFKQITRRPFGPFSMRGASTERNADPSACWTR